MDVADLQLQGFFVVKEMEGNLCDVNHLDSNARLPPRKRLLAGLKNQNADGDYGSRHLSSSETASESPFSPSGGFDVFIDKWMGSQESTDNRSAEEFIEASKLAVKFAVAARSKAETKAALAAKAIHMAKQALELSATIAEEFARRERLVKKNKRKMKMKMKVKKKKQVIQSVRILGRKPRQTKNSSQQQNVSSNSKGNVINKRLKVNHVPENPDPISSDELKSDGSSEETHSVGSDENPSKSIRIDESGAESSQRKKNGVKKSRLKQKNCPY